MDNEWIDLDEFLATMTPDERADSARRHLRSIPINDRMLPIVDQPQQFPGPPNLPPWVTYDPAGPGTTQVGFNETRRRAHASRDSADRSCMLTSFGESCPKPGSNQ